MNQERLDLLKAYITANIAPILVEGISAAAFTDGVIIPSNCDISLLNGYYEGIEFVPPNWYVELVNKNTKPKILIIDNLSSVSKNEQCKFIELLKYHKISTFELPEDTVIVITSSKVSAEIIAPEIYELVAHV